MTLITPLKPIRVPSSGIIPYSNGGFYNILPDFDSTATVHNYIYPTGINTDVQPEFNGYLYRLKHWRYNDWKNLRITQSGWRSMVESEPVRWAYTENAGSGNNYHFTLTKPLSLLNNGFNINPNSGTYELPPSGLTVASGYYRIPEWQAGFMVYQVASGLNKMFNDPRNNSLHFGYPLMNQGTEGGTGDSGSFIWFSPFNLGFPHSRFQQHDLPTCISGDITQSARVFYSSGSGLKSPMFSKAVHLRLLNIEDDKTDFYPWEGIVRAASGIPQESGNLGININAAQQIRYPMQMVNSYFIRQSGDFSPGTIGSHHVTGFGGLPTVSLDIQNCHFQVLSSFFTVAWPLKHRAKHTNTNGTLSTSITSGTFVPFPPRDVNFFLDITGTTSHNFTLSNSPDGTTIDDPDKYHYTIRPRVHVFLDEGMIVNSGGILSTTPDSNGIPVPSSILSLDLSNPSGSFIIPSGYFKMRPNGIVNNDVGSFNPSLHSFTTKNSCTIALMGYYEIRYDSGFLSPGNFVRGSLTGVALQYQAQMRVNDIDIPLTSSPRFLDWTYQISGVFTPRTNLADRLVPPSG